jgi:hypothetical protein
MFASYSLEDKSGGSYTIPKLNMKKSRLGCQRCKARRVKVSNPMHRVSMILIEQAPSATSLNRNVKTVRDTGQPASTSLRNLRDSLPKRHLRSSIPARMTTAEGTLRLMVTYLITMET